jgi:hypothetical protein
LFSDAIDAEENHHNFVRLSPQIMIDKKVSPLVNRLYHLDMDVTKQEEIEDLKQCFKKWQEGVILNEPIQWTKTIDEEYIFARGHRYFNDALVAIDWL